MIPPAVAEKLIDCPVHFVVLPAGVMLADGKEFTTRDAILLMTVLQLFVIT